MQFKKMDSCEKFYVEIHKDGNLPYHPFGIEKDNEFPFNRITVYGDIAQIDIEYMENGEINYLSFYPKWVGDSGVINDNQDSVVGENGNLYLKIGKKSLEDYFGKNYEYRKWWWGESNESGN